MIELEAMEFFAGPGASRFLARRPESRTTRRALSPDDEPTDEDWEDAETIVVEGEKEVNPGDVVPGYQQDPGFGLTPPEWGPGRGGRDGSGDGGWGPPTSSPSVDRGPFWSGVACNRSGESVTVKVWDCDNKAWDIQTLNPGDCTVEKGHDWDAVQVRGKWYKLGSYWQNGSVLIGAKTVDNAVCETSEERKCKCE